MAKRKAINYNIVKEVTKSASLSEQFSNKELQQVIEINIDELEQNPYQPRLKIDDIQLSELADSIKNNGLIQPITVMKTYNSTYTIMYGHRRVAAHIKLGINTIKAIVLENVDHAQLAILPLIENLQREDMNSIETALSMKRILNENLVNNQSALAELLGLTKSWVSKILSILKLPDDVIKQVQKEKYNDITILSALNKLNDNHINIFNKIKNLDRKAALKYIQSMYDKKENIIDNRILALNNKITINIKGLSSTKRSEIQQYIDKIDKILHN